MNEFSQQLKRNSGSPSSDNLTTRSVHDIATRVKKIIGISDVHPRLSVSEQSSHSQRLSFSPISDGTISATRLTLSEDTQSMMLDYRSILNGSSTLVSLKKHVVQKNDSADSTPKSLEMESCKNNEDTVKTSDIAPAESQIMNEDTEGKLVEGSVKKESQPTEDTEVTQSSQSADHQIPTSETSQSQEVKMAVSPVTRSQSKRVSQPDQEPSHTLRSHRSPKSKGDESETHGKSCLDIVMN